MKILKITLALCLLLCSLTVSISADDLPPLTGEEGFEEWIDIIPGDLNLDGAVDATDSNILKRGLAGSISMTADQIKAADINGDVNITSVDANLLKRMLVGLTIIR